MLQSSVVSLITAALSRRSLPPIALPPPGKHGVHAAACVRLLHRPGGVSLGHRRRKPANLGKAALDARPGGS